MSFFKISLPKEPDMIPVYTQAAKAAEALARIQRLLGVLKGAKVEEVKQADIPEGTNLL